MGSYTISVVGESFRNADGSSRQSIIGRCRVGDSVTLEREPDNPHDANAVKVLTHHGCIGMIGRDDSWICERIEHGRHVAACIQSIGDGGRGTKGVVLRLSTNDRIDPASELPKRGLLARIFG